MSRRKKRNIEQALAGYGRGSRWPEALKERLDAKLAELSESDLNKLAHLGGKWQASHWEPDEEEFPAGVV